MPSTLQHARQLAKVFIKAKNKKTAVNHIVSEINSLVYGDSKQPIESAVKIEIIQLINELLAGKKPLDLSGEIIFAEETDKAAFLLMTNYILKEVISFHRAGSKTRSS